MKEYLINRGFDILCFKRKYKSLVKYDNVF